MPATLGELSGWIGPRTDSTGRMVFAPLLCNTKLDVAQELKSNRRFSKLWVFLISHFEDMPELLPPRPSLQHLFGLPTRFTRTETDCICVKSSCQSYQEGTILFCSGHPIKGLQIVRKGIVALLFAGSRVGLLYEGTMLDCRWLMFAPHSFPSLWTYQAETACEIATVRPALLQTLLGVDTPLQSRFFWNQAYVLAQQLQILHLPPGSSAALSRGERRRRVNSKAACCRSGWLGVSIDSCYTSVSIKSNKSLNCDVCHIFHSICCAYSCHGGFHHQPMVFENYFFNALSGEI